MDETNRKPGIGYRARFRMPDALTVGVRPLFLDLTGRSADPWRRLGYIRNRKTPHFGPARHSGAESERACDGRALRATGAVLHTQRARYERLLLIGRHGVRVPVASPPPLLALEPARTDGEACVYV